MPTSSLPSTTCSDHTTPTSTATNTTSGHCLINFGGVKFENYSSMPLQLSLIFTTLFSITFFGLAISILVLACITFAIVIISSLTSLCCR